MKNIKHVHMESKETNEATNNSKKENKVNKEKNQINNNNGILNNIESIIINLSQSYQDFDKKENDEKLDKNE